MSITINWDDPNTIDYDEVRVYRSVNKTEGFELVGSVNPHINVYVDNEQLPQNTVYYYRFDIYRDGIMKAASVITPAGYYPTGTGPGPQEVTRGDWDFGYFGEVDTGSLPNIVDICEGFSEASSEYDMSSNGVNVTRWYKFIVNKKIIFIPNHYFKSQADIVEQNQYAIPTDSLIPNSFNICKVGGDSFNVRLPTFSNKFGINEAIDVETYDVDTDETIQYSEVAAILSIMGATVTDRYGGISKMAAESGVMYYNNPLSTNNRIVDESAEGYSCYSIPVVWGNGVPVVSISGSRTILPVAEYLFN